MFELFKKYRNIVIFVVILVIVIAGYVLFFGGDSRESDDLLVSEPVVGNTTVGREVLETLITLQSLTLDESVFERSDFRVLTDFSTNIAPQPVGRQNPFAPIGVGGGASVSVDGEE